MGSEYAKHGRNGSTVADAVPAVSGLLGSTDTDTGPMRLLKPFVSIRSERDHSCTPVIP